MNAFDHVELASSPQYTLPYTDFAVKSLQNTDVHFSSPTTIPNCGLQSPKLTLESVGEYLIYNGTLSAQAADPTGSHLRHSGVG